ncbi:MAG: hypothetical protein JW910_05090 [Anaerolineae bacterium]|nr:hypothetical protein [Anaerolineae bacterium]
MNRQPDTSAARREARMLLMIMLIAVFLRAEYLLQIEHNTDHAWPVTQALETLDRGIWPLVGQGTSVLFASPPLTGYLYLPVVAITRSPLGVYVFVIALNTLAVLLAYRAVKTLLGWRPALIAALLLAVNPWVVEYSRTSWVQSLVPFFATATAWLLWPVLLGQSRRPVRRTTLALIMLTGLAQTYLLGFALVLPVALLIVIFRRRVPVRGLLIGGAVFVLALALYGAGLLAQWDTVQTRLNDFSSGEARLTDEAISHAVRLVTGDGYALARGTDAPMADSALRHDLSQIAHMGLVLALVVGIVRAGWEMVMAVARRGINSPAANGKKSTKVDSDRAAAVGSEFTSVGLSVSAWEFMPGRRDAALIALVWFALPVVMMSYVGQPVHPFYQLIGLPAGYVLAAWGLSPTVRLPRPIRVALILLVALPFSILMGLNSARYYQETAAIPGAHGLSALSLEYGLPVGAAVWEALPADGVGYFAEEQGWILNSFSGRAFPVWHETRAPAFSIIPAGGGVYVAAHEATAPAFAPPTGAQRAASFTTPDGLLLTIDAFPPEAAARCATEDGAFDVPSEQGLTLHAAWLAPTEGGYTLTTLWRVDGRPAEADHWLFAPFAHLFDAAGQRVGVISGEAVPGYEWRIGDCHVHQMWLALPPDAAGPFTLQIGQYDAIRAENAIFVLPDGEYTPLYALPDQLE